MKRYVSLLLALLTLGACDLFKNPDEPTPPIPENEVHYAALGASDTLGIGGSAPCAPLAACPDGTGYVQIIGRRLQSAGKTVTLMNLGIPGAVLSPEIQAIGNSLGRNIFGNVLEREMPFVPRDTTLATVFVGANDANTIGAAIEAGRGGTDPAGYLVTQTQNFGRDLRTLVAGIRDRASQSRIVVLNLPNLAGLPYASGYSLPRRRGLQQIAVGFSQQINALTAQGVLVVDLMCDDTFYRSGLYSGDGFHLNDAGYSALADVVHPPATTGSAAPPRSSCPQMILF